MLIVLEGLDGTGKSTQVRMLKEYLASKEGQAGTCPSLRRRGDHRMALCSGCAIGLRHPFRMFLRLLHRHNTDHL